MKRALLLALICGLTRAAWARQPSVIKVTIDGADRTALVFAPEKGSGKAPVVFGFHGHGGSMHLAARGMHFQDAWPEAIVVYPQGLPTAGIILDKQGLKPGWQREAGQLADRDLRFVDAILEKLHKTFSVDDNRIYASGFSNGGLFTYLLWAQRPHVFAAFAPGGAVLLPSVHLTQPRAALHFGGERDQLARFNRQRETMEEIRKFDHCDGPGQPCGQNCTLYPSSSGTPVETYIHSGGHVYPPPVTDVIVKFFQEHTRKS